MTTSLDKADDRYGERGVLVSQYAAAFPILLLWILIPIQVAFWYNAREAALLASEEAAFIVATEDADVGKATFVALELIQADPTLTNPRIQFDQVGGDTVTVTITTEISWRILPFPKDVVARSRVQREIFIPQDER